MKKLFIAFILTMALFSVRAQISDPFFQHVTYSGAFGYEDWTAGWANWDPQNTVYPGTSITIPAQTITTNTTWAPSNSPVNGAASFADPYLSNSFFEPVSFVGAFGPTDWTKPWANFDPQNVSYTVPNVTIPAGALANNQTWTYGNTYLLNGYVYVPNGVTLTIEPGVVIRGDEANKGTLIVERGGKLIAQGTPTLPIVFTSNNSIGNRDYGDWGGIILCGRAVNNQGNDVLIEGGVNAFYGGQDNNDNSGILKYVRIEFCGIAFAPNNEINGLTMGSVGSGTTIDYVQVSFSGDDAFEWFGGKVNCKHIIAHRAWDDDFDTDFGFTGLIQFAVSLRDPNIADISGSNGFESDNDAAGSTFTPITKPIFSNVSIFGPKATSSTTIHIDYKRAMHLRRNTQTSIFNSLFCGYPTGLLVEGALCDTSFKYENLKIENTFLVGMNTYYDSFDGVQFSVTSKNNQTNGAYGVHSWLQIGDPFNLTNPNFLPQKNVYLLNGWVYIDTLVTLTIQPGTIIRGDKALKGSIIVERGGKLIAEGNQNEPIIFTSNVVSGSRAAGDWGGIILCGRATINQAGGTAVIEGGVGAIYGGGNTPDNADNSGKLKYCRIEYPGVAFVENNEINGLTMGGVGTGTTIDYVQVSNSGDDSFEWFGGTVNARHLIAFKGLDDDFDTDNGFVGKVQFAVSLRDPDLADASGSNAFESDNDAAGSTNTPNTHPTFSNVSIFGPLATPSTTINSNYKRAMHLRRNTMCSVHNSLFMGWPIGLFIEGALTQGNANIDSLKVDYSFISGMTNKYAAAFDSTYYENSSRNNTKFNSNSGMMITNPFNQTSPNFLPLAGSPVLFGSRWVKTIQGKIEYENTALTDLNNVIVICKNNSGLLISRDTTNSSGDYSLKAVDGVFNLYVECPKPWGGVTISDVIKMRRILASIPPDSYTPLQQIACDVNMFGGVNISDVIYERQKLAGFNVPQWIISDYIFESATVSIAPGAGITTKNIKGLCAGDANGSYTPPAK